jgi:hypothetical protein
VCSAVPAVLILPSYFDNEKCVPVFCDVIPLSVAEVEAMSCLMCTVQQSHLNYAVRSGLLFSNLLRDLLFYGTENLITDFTNPLVELIQNQSLSMSSAGFFCDLHSIK